MSVPDSLRGALLRAAADVLLRVEECAPTEAPEPEVLSNGRWEVHVEVRHRAEGQAAARDGAGTGQAVTGEIAEQIRAVLGHAERPLKLTVIAARARREPTNYLRETVRRMVAAGELLHLERPHRYWPANRPLPSGQ